MSTYIPAVGFSLWGAKQDYVSLTDPRSPRTEDEPTLSLTGNLGTIVSPMKAPTLLYISTALSSGVMIHAGSPYFKLDLTIMSIPQPDIRQPQGVRNRLKTASSPLTPLPTTHNLATSRPRFPSSGWPSPTVNFQGSIAHPCAPPPPPRPPLQPRWSARNFCATQSRRVRDGVCNYLDIL